MKSKSKRHHHSEKRSVDNLSERLDRLSDFIFDIAPSSIQCHCAPLSLASKTPLTVVSEDAISVLYYCPDCDTPVALSGIFDMHNWVAHDLESNQIAIMLDAAKQANLVSLFQMLLQYKIRKSAPNN